MDKKSVSDKKINFIEDINKFVLYLIETNNMISYASIARAIGRVRTNEIKKGKLTYKAALLIKNTYINNYKTYKELTT